MMVDEDKTCPRCRGKRFVPDSTILCDYPEDRPCPDCTDGSWADADRLRTTPAPDARGREGTDDLMFLAKWVERGLFDKSVTPKDALEVIANYPGMPWHRLRWDVDHKPYADAFYTRFPEARAALGAKPHPYGRPILDMLKDGNGGGERGEDD